MATAHVTWSYDTGEDQDIDLILSKVPRRERSAYIRQALRFYGLNQGKSKDGASDLKKMEERILCRLDEIEARFKQGVVGQVGQKEDGAYLAAYDMELFDEN